jgi:hypothetical protein
VEPAYVTAVIAGAVAITVAVLSPAFSAAAERRLDKRKVLAGAVGALAAYREYPYVIRRRDAADPSGERRRISGEIMAVQRQLTEASIWIAAESSRLHEEFDAALAAHRRVAGGLMNEAWRAEPAHEDVGMNVESLQAQLAPLEEHDRQLAQLIKSEVRFSWNPFR